MARRRKTHEEPENHERWLVSYADFITLLFAFFVVMYSISSVNEGKYRVLSNTLTDAFIKPAQSQDPIQIGDPVRSMLPGTGEYSNPQTTPAASADDTAQQVVENSPAQTVSLATVASDVKQSLQPYIDQDLVDVTQTDRGVEIEMKSKMLFKSGSASLSANAVKALRGVARILRSIPNAIHVEGHTDNVPINTPVFPSNWELSAARAASVVHLFNRFGVDSRRMAAIGYGEYRPREDNDTEAGRAANRRVSIVIMADQHDRAAGEIVPRTPWGER
jgi:chemotaxis protein MotB